MNKMLPDKLAADISLDKNNKPLNKKHGYNTRNKKQLPHKKIGNSLDCKNHSRPASRRTYAKPSSL